MPFDNEFTCPDGHKFRANAKRLSRCPECGKTARRLFSKVTDLAKTEPVSEPPPIEPKPKHSQIELLKKGKPRVTMAKRTPAKPPVTKKKPLLKKKAPAPKLTTASKIVKKTSLRGVVKPTVKGRPPRTAVARHVVGQNKSYSDRMMEQYGWRRS